MGCCTGMGRLLLVLFNLVFLLIALAILAGGVILKFFGNVVAKMLGYVQLPQSTSDDFNIPDLEEVSELPFVEDIGVAMIVFGAVLTGIAFFACCGACCKYRPLLILFVIAMIVMIICQAVVGGLFIAEDTILHDKIKNTVGDEVKNNFNANGTAVLDSAVNLMNYMLECCGIRGWEDFDSNMKPPSCCNRTIIDGPSPGVWDVPKQQCASNPPTAPNAYYNNMGCYSVLQDKVTGNTALVACVLGAILLVQLLEVIFACLIVKQVNDENNKVGSC